MSRARTAVLATGETDEPGLWSEVVAFVRQFIVAAFDPYRPEQHYMRGPGPACRARSDTPSR